ncbi:50S ribosomal protein L22 [Candidatus Curtissbacteria bacterium]|nr:50S ribosomal protein L22 [Candidatus Curtissbacteria bacterium]
MEVRAIAKNVRISPEKVRLVVDKIKKMRPREAIEVLEFLPQKAAKPLKKVIGSALANAKNNFGLDEQTLAFRELAATKGLTFKRYRPVSRGRAHHILKRTSRITVVLEGEQKKQQAPKLEEGGASKATKDKRLTTKVK